MLKAVIDLVENSRGLFDHDSVEIIYVTADRRGYTGVPQDMIVEEDGGIQNGGKTYLNLG